MPRSVTTSRVLAEATITPTDIPSADGDMVTVAVTVPVRGLIHRASLLWGKSSAFAFNNTSGGMYVHTACAAGAGAGTTRLVSADAQSIIAAGAMNPKNGNKTGGDLAIGSSIYVWVHAIDLNPNVKGTNDSSDESSVATGGGPVGVFYDVSGTTLGPSAGTGTLFFTWIAGADLNDDALFCKLRLEIEPVS